MDSDILGLIHVILKRGSWWWWHYQNVPFHHVATYETCFIFPKTGRCNHCISKQAHGWGQYCHNSGAAGVWFGNPGQWLEARGLSWINVRFGDSGGHSWFCECKNEMKVLRPPILEDLEVFHRLGKPAPGTAESVDVPIPTPVPNPGYTPANPDMQFEVPPAPGDTVQPAPSIRQPRPHPLCALSW